MILGMALAVALPRVLPVAVLSRVSFSDRAQEWLSYIAPAVLASLLAVSILAPRGVIDISWHNRYLIAFIPTMGVAIKTRSLFYSLLTGIVVMAALNYYL